MGSGKTTAAIKYMNDHPDKKFIYVTPYLEETERIRAGCPNLNFFLPNNWDAKHRTPTTKKNSAQEAIHLGLNVATTHVLFGLFNDEMREDIRSHNYTLLLDEVLNVIQKLPISPYDVRVIEQACAVSIDPTTNAITMIDECDDENSKYYEITKNLEVGDIYKYGNAVFLSLLSPRTILSFENVIMMTYMFDAQFQRGLFDLNHLEYHHLYVCKNGDSYEFTTDSSLSHNPLRGIRKYITITNYSKSNDVGKSFYALSAEWYKKDFQLNPNYGKRHKLIANHGKNMVRRGFRNGDGRIPRYDLLWTCYKRSASEIDCYELCYDENFFAPCTTKATNMWADRHYLIYLVNRFCDPNFRSFFNSKNVALNDDYFALSELVQWVWRSAIRNREHIYIYIPSARMRELLISWLNYVSEHTEPYTVDCLPDLQHLKKSKQKSKKKSLIKKDYKPFVWHSQRKDG